MIPVALAAALALAALYFILKPLVEDRSQRATDPPLSPVEKLQREKEGVFLAIREVEFDHRTGVVSDEDHAALIARYKARAVELMKEIDGLAVTLADPGTASPPPRCPACGAETTIANRFCTRCGHAFPEAAPGSLPAAEKGSP